MGTQGEAAQTKPGDCRGDTCSEGNGVDSRLLARGMLGPWIYCML